MVSVMHPRARVSVEGKSMLIEQVLAEKGGQPITVPPETAAIEIAQIMAARKTGLVMVCSPGGLLLGVVSERDLIRIVAQDHTLLDRLQAQDAMVGDVSTCAPNSVLREVMETMHNRGFRHMPVVRHGALVGLVSSRDLLKYLLAESELHERAAAWSDMNFL
jgi:CBS domain-containing protein